MSRCLCTEFSFTLNHSRDYTVIFKDDRCYLLTLTVLCRDSEVKPLMFIISTLKMLVYSLECFRVNYNFVERQHLHPARLTKSMK